MSEYKLNFMQTRNKPRRLLLLCVSLVSLSFSFNTFADVSSASAANATRMKIMSKLPDWSGIWVVKGTTRTLDPSGKTLRYNEEWLNKLDEEDRKHGLKRDSLTLTCVAGFPRLLAMPYPFAIMITPEEVLVHYAHREVRRIYTDGRDHPAVEELWPNAWGDSVGHWEGDTLVISTVSTKPDLWIDSTGATLSAQAEITERITRINQGHLKSDITINDPTSLDQPWKFTRLYRRTFATDIVDEQCDFSAIKKSK